MILLKDGIITNPFFMLAFFLLIAGAASLLFKLIRDTKSGNRKYGKDRRQKKENRFTTIGFVILLIAVLAGLIFFIIWLGKMKYD